MSSQQRKNSPFIIVGIGASAGGLTVLKQFVRSLPKQSGMAYIVVQHLAPTHESMLSELLAKECDIPVQDAEDKQAVVPEHVYVIPPDTYLELQGETIQLTQPRDTRGSRKAIDHFFRSLAQERGDCCAGIVLSGSGGDGTAGLRAIKAAGGLALAQKPDEAEHASMPLSAIEADVVDKVSTVGEMAEVLSRFARHPMTQKRQDNQKSEVAESDQSLEEIAAILKTHEDFNLNQYKPTTIQRRISRRMSLTNTGSYADYLQKLRDEDDERRQPTKDLLINVTDFFRDPEAFDVLEQTAIPEILDKRSGHEDIRVWVPSCASGEEAYSLAILLLEACRERGMKNEIKIFATDIDQYAINTARRGLYADSIAEEVPQKYLERYFVKIENDHHYKVKSRVRDLISFAEQNVVTDPPFNHMHLISCRNLLIYLNREVQQKVLSSFYFALDDDCFLFLGSSESLGNKAGLFKTNSKKWRLYRKIPGQEDKHTRLESLQLGQRDNKNEGASSPLTTQARRSTVSRSTQMRLSIMESVTPPTLLVDGKGQVLYSHGDLAPYVDFPQGEPRYELTQLVKPAMRSRVRSALYKVKKSREKLHFRCTVQDANQRQHKRIVHVSITPIQDAGYADGDAYALVFSQGDALLQEQQDKLTPDDENKAYASMEQELAETREELQNTIEELETSTEELTLYRAEALVDLSADRQVLTHRTIQPLGHE